MNNIFAPGYIPSVLMPLLYNCCNLFLYPSLRESFGLPVLEAMACGVPVVTSAIPALREVGGEAAVFIDPENPIAIAEAISSLLMNEETGKGLIQKGIERAGMFTWESSARKLIALYEKL